jgi:hypothetical protein
MVPHRILLLLFFLSVINAQIGLPTFQGIHKPQSVSASCDQSVTYSFSDRGWYTSSGTHNSTNNNVIVGSYYRNWFTFDISGFSGTACTITLRLELELFNGSSGNYNLYDISTGHDDLVASSSGSSGVTIYNDLGTGNSYGSVSLTSSDNNSTIEIALNDQAITDFNSESSGWFSVGGDWTGSVYIRFGSGPSDTFSQLVITY